MGKRRRVGRTILLAIQFSPCILRAGDAKDIAEIGVGIWIATTHQKMDIFKRIDRHFARGRRRARAAVASTDDAIFKAAQNSRSLVFPAVCGILIVLFIPASLLARIGLENVGVVIIPRAHIDFEYLRSISSNEFSIAYINGITIQLIFSVYIYFFMIARYLMHATPSCKKSFLSSDRVRLTIYLLFLNGFFAYILFCSNEYMAAGHSWFEDNTIAKIPFYPQPANNLVFLSTGILFILMAYFLYFMSAHLMSYFFSRKY